jgi:1-acyl-sn-glycerol-3-phosphate acyltransferase
MTGSALASVSRLLAGTTVEWRCDAGADVQRIYFANHASHLDFLVVWSLLPARLRQWARPVAGRDYWEQGAIRRWLAGRVFNAVLIDRQPDLAVPHADAARAAVERMAREMGRRHSLIVFPEGTRSRNGEVAPFKSGLYHLTRLRPGVELIPVHLENLGRILPKGEALPVPMLSRAVFGPPLPSPEDEAKDHFLGRARAALLDLGAS